MGDEIQEKLVIKLNCLKQSEYFCHKRQKGKGLALCGLMINKLQKP
jgi:hypothetical protein